MLRTLFSQAEFLQNLHLPPQTGIFGLKLPDSFLQRTRFGFQIGQASAAGIQKLIPPLTKAHWRDARFPAKLCHWPLAAQARQDQIYFAVNRPNATPEGRVYFG